MVKVVVTTEFRGVFFGSMESPMVDRVLILENARNCLYWPVENKGFLGLVAQGPLEGARVGPAVPLLTLTCVTSVSECTPDAVARWESGPWT